MIKKSKNIDNNVYNGLMLVFFGVIIAIVLLLFISGCSLQSSVTTTTMHDNDKAIIVTVDGLSFSNTILGTTIPNTDNYLQTNLKKIIKTDAIIPFNWSGDASDTSIILEASGSGSLREFMRKNYQLSKDLHKKFIVISHSWGTFLSYLALSMEPQIQCDLFITLSSPLGTSSGLSSSPEKIVRDYTDGKLSAMSFNISGSSYPNTKVFYNFMSNGDLISGTLSGKISASLNVVDVKLDDGISDTRLVTDCYFWHKYSTLGDEVVSETVYTVYLATLGITDISPVRNVFINKVAELINSASGN